MLKDTFVIEMDIAKPNTAGMKMCQTSNDTLMSNSRYSKLREFDKKYGCFM